MLKFIRIDSRYDDFADMWHTIAVSDALLNWIIENLEPIIHYHYSLEEGTCVNVSDQALTAISLVSS